MGSGLLMGKRVYFFGNVNVLLFDSDDHTTLSILKVTEGYVRAHEFYLNKPGINTYAHTPHT